MSGVKSRWDRLPLEILGMVVSNLEGVDMKSCRLVDKRTSVEATRILFQTLQLCTGYRRNAQLILENQHLAANIQHLCATFWDESPKDDDNLKWIAKKLKSCRLKSFDVEAASPQSLSYVLTYPPEIVKCLENNTNFGMIMCESIFNATPDLISTITQGCLELPTRIPLVRDLCFGFTDYDLETPPWASKAMWTVQARLSRHLFMATFPNLTRLCLQSTTATVDDLVGFIRRHNHSLRTLELSRCELHKEDGNAFGSSSDEAGKRCTVVDFLRLIILLHTETKLQQMVFIESLTTTIMYNDDGEIMNRLCFNGSGTWCTKPLLPGDLLTQIQDFVCHRGLFPFELLRPHMAAIVEQRIGMGENFDTLIVPGPRGSKLEITLEHDDTFKLQAFVD